MLPCCGVAGDLAIFWVPIAKGCLQQPDRYNFNYPLRPGDGSNMARLRAFSRPLENPQGGDCRINPVCHNAAKKSAAFSLLRAKSVTKPL